MAHIISITDFDTPELDVYARLTENQLVNRADPANALFIAESPLVIGRALESGCVPVSFLMEPRHLTSQALPLLERCPEDIPVYTAAPEVLTRLTGFHLTRGMLCAMRRPALPTVEEVCANARRIAVLENVMNPTNIGAIFRCAAALGMDAVLLTAAGSDPLYRRASRVSMGNVFLVPWTYLPEEAPWPERLRRLGFQTVAMALRGGLPERGRRQRRGLLPVGADERRRSDITKIACCTLQKPAPSYGYDGAGFYFLIRRGDSLRAEVNDHGDESQYQTRQPNQQGRGRRPTEIVQRHFIPVGGESAVSHQFIDGNQKDDTVKNAKIPQLCPALHGTFPPNMDDHQQGNECSHHGKGFGNPHQMIRQEKLMEKFLIPFHLRVGRLIMKIAASVSPCTAEMDEQQHIANQADDRRHRKTILFRNLRQIVISFPFHGWMATDNFNISSPSSFVNIVQLLCIIYAICQLRIRCLAKIRSNQLVGVLSMRKHKKDRRAFCGPF